MSNPKVPQAINFSSQEDRIEEPMIPALKCAKYSEMVKSNADSSIQELHENRLKNLRKEIDFLKETSWKYNPIEKYIGQSGTQY